MKILVSYRGIPQSPGWATGDMVVKAFRELGHETYAYAKYYEEERWVETLPAEIQRDGVDLIIFMECNDGDRQYTELRTLPARHMACWLFDTSYYPDQCQELVKWFNFDHLFLANPHTIAHYRSIGYNNVHYLPYACDPQLHGRSLETPKTRRVALIGSDRSDRRQLAHDLDRYGIELELISGVFREQYIDTLASAKIVVNQNPAEGRGLLNMRWFETPAAGSLIIGEESDRTANSPFKDIGIGYVNVCDLAAECDYYLSNPEELKKKTKQLQDHVFQHHTYENRCQQILDWYAETR